MRLSLRLRHSRIVAQLDDARRLLEAGDAHAALRSLERARDDLLAERDLDGLHDLRRLAEQGYAESHDRDEAAYESLLYASAQNIRWLSRKRALERGVAWEDPHPELDAPGRPEMRVEREVTRAHVPWILVAVVAAIAIGALIVLWAESAH